MDEASIEHALRDIFEREDYDLHKDIDTEGAYPDVVADFIRAYNEHATSTFVYEVR